MNAFDENTNLTKRKSNIKPNLTKLFHSITKTEILENVNRNQTKIELDIIFYNVVMWSPKYDD